jgi:putative hydrolase
MAARRRSKELVPSVRYDFHSHSYLSDGADSPTGMWHSAQELSHRALALTDHVSFEDPAPLLRRLREEASAWEGTRFYPIVGVELTFLPPRKIAERARVARKAGAQIVIVHGETIAEVVPKGTNRAALESGQVDILAHPGLLTRREAEIAKANSVVLEISARKGHSLANGHVVRTAIEAGAQLVVDSDAHRPSDLVPPSQAHRIALGAGVPENLVDAVLTLSPRELLRRCASG